MVGHGVCETTCKLVGDLTVQIGCLSATLAYLGGSVWYMVDNVFCLTK